MRRLSDAFAPVPPVVDERIDQALRKMHAGEQRRRTKPLLALALTLVLLLSMGGVAAAAGNGVLEYLFPRTSPTEEQRLMAQDVSWHWQGEGVSVTVPDILFDGRRLSVSVQVQSESPLYTLVEGVWLDGCSTGNTCGLMEGWVKAPDEGIFPVERGFSVTEEARVHEGPTQVRFRLVLLEPMGEVVPMSKPNSDEENEAIQQEAEALIDQGRVPITPYQGHIMCHRGRGVSFANDPAYDFPRYSQRYVQSANMRLVQELEVSLTAMGAMGESVEAYTVADNQELPFEVAGCTAFLSEAGTYVKLALAAREGGMSREALVRLMQETEPVLYSAEGHSLPYQDMTHDGEGMGGETEEGFEVQLVKPPLEGEATDVIYLIPCGLMDGEPLWDCAIRLEKAAEASK